MANHFSLFDNKNGERECSGYSQEKQIKRHIYFAR